MKGWRPPIDSRVGRIASHPCKERKDGAPSFVMGVDKKQEPDRRPFTYRSQTEGVRTEGEKLFELYLASQGLRFEFAKKYAEKLKVLDYRIEWNGKPHFFEVKDFGSPWLPRAGGFGVIQGYKPIRERIIRWP